MPIPFLVCLPVKMPNQQCLPLPGKNWAAADAAGDAWPAGDAWSADAPAFPEADALDPAGPSEAAMDRLPASAAAERMAGRAPRLDAAREQELFSQYRNGSEEARQTLIEMHLWLVSAIAVQYAGRGIDVSDLVGEGCLGVIRALGRFDPARGCRFSTYASWWIREAIRRHLLEKGRTVRLPAPVIHAVTTCQQLRRRLRAINGWEPRLTELAQALDKPAGAVQALLQYQEAAVSLDVPAHAETAESVVDHLPDETSETPEQQAVRRQAVACLMECLRELPARDQALLAQRYGLHQQEAQSVVQIAAAWNLSCSRLHIIETRALARLRQVLQRHGLTDDLLPDG